jgi:formylglycine-generating enzyme required for sulfatase activity
LTSLFGMPFRPTLGVTRVNPWARCIWGVPAVLLAGILLAGVSAAGPAGGAESAPGMQGPPSGKEDVVYFRNGDVLRGRVMNNTFRILTPDGPVDVKRDQCSAVFLEDGNQRIKDRLRPVAGRDRSEPEDRSDEKNPGVLTSSVGMRLKRIEPGEFLMGSDKGSADEAPPHRVAVTKPYYLGVREVTQREWESVMGSNPSYFRNPLHPVEMVSFEDAQRFCRELTRREKRTYRLPTEAEWEYACRAGTSTEFPWGDEFREDAAWCASNAGGKTHEVGTREPNAWGLHDMTGNVWEWVEDAYGPYPGGAVPEDSRRSGTERVLRGGGWFNVTERCRAASRAFQKPDYASSSAAGFRVVAEP